MNELPAGRTQPRPSWDVYFLKLAMLASERATCPRMHCGCVLVKNNRVLATGYNGSLPGDVWWKTTIASGPTTRK